MRGRRLLGLLAAMLCAITATAAPVFAEGLTTSEAATVAAEVPPPAPFRVEDDDTRLAFRGSWRYVWSTTSSGFSRRCSRTAGSYVLVRFTGTGAALIAPLRTDAGMARISIDGVDVATVSLYSSSPATSAAIWSIDGLSEASHVIKVTVLGQREPASSGTLVSVDSFDIDGRPAAAAVASGSVVQHDDWRLYRRGSWRKRYSTSALAGSSMYTAEPGRSVTVHFNGSSLMWLGRKSPSHGKSEVLLDGHRVAVVAGAPGSARERAVLWAISGLRYGKHTVVVRTLGVPAESSLNTGTVTDIDAFVVGGTVLFAPRPTPFKYPWRTYIVVDKSQFRLYWVKNGMLRKYYPVAHGKEGWATPCRLWRIDAKYLTWPGSVYGPRKLRMFKQVGSSYVFSNYAIHGTSEEWVIGTRASHGCIRMYNRDVLELFGQVPLGTMVVTRD